MLTDNEKERIVAAVKSVESQTNGEVVVCVVPTSGDYDAAAWRASVLFALVAICLMILFRNIAGDWSPAWLAGDYVLLGIAVLCGFTGAIAGEYLPAVRRGLTLRRYMNSAVASGAAKAFVSEEVFATRNRTGILLYVSLFERHIEVVADGGIRKQTADTEWIHVVDTVRSRLETEGRGEAIAAGVEECGNILARLVGMDQDSANELDDAIRFPDVRSDDDDLTPEQ